jgi:hypothetical protein
MKRDLVTIDITFSSLEDYRHVHKISYQGRFSLLEVWDEMKLLIHRLNARQETPLVSHGVMYAMTDENGNIIANNDRKEAEEKS